MNEENQPSDDQRVSALPTTLRPVPQVSSPQTAASASQKFQEAEKDAERRMSTAEEQTITLNKLAIGISVVASFFVVAQWWEMRQTMRLDERAWVGPSSPPTVKNLDYAQGHGNYAFTLKNFGKTPALRLHSAWETSADERTLRAEQDSLCESTTHGDGRVLWPEENRETLGDFNLPQPSPMEPKAVFIVGCVTYKDIFGTSHWSRYCFKTKDASLPEQEMVSCFTNEGTDDN